VIQSIRARFLGHIRDGIDPQELHFRDADTELFPHFASQRGFDDVIGRGLGARTVAFPGMDSREPPGNPQEPLRR